jgi:hypothetical protein
MQSLPVSRHFNSGPHIPLSTLFSNTIYVLPLAWETEFLTHTKPSVNKHFSGWSPAQNPGTWSYKLQMALFQTWQITYLLLRSTSSPMLHTQLRTQTKIPRSQRPPSACMSTTADIAHARCGGQSHWLTQDIPSVPLCSTELTAGCRCDEGQVPMGARMGLHRTPRIPQRQGAVYGNGNNVLLYVFSSIKENLPSFLTKHHAMKTYGGVEI